MIIFPAIDILDGDCVRLRKGDFSRKTVFNSDPLSQAKMFAEEGALWLHLVDLRAAKTGVRTDGNLVKRISEETGLKIQTGGGIRNPEDAMRLVSAGAERIVLGSIAMEQPELCETISRTIGADRIVIALDFQKEANGSCALYSRGWTEKKDFSIGELTKRYLRAGISGFIFTNIQKDGTGSGPDWEFYDQCSRDFPECQFVVSGGISSLLDVGKAKKSGASGVIIGQSLYTKQFTLREALNAC